MYYHRIILYFDGASRNNPHGPAGCGWVIFKMGSNGHRNECIAHGNSYLGYNVTNNQAEYEGLCQALKYMVDFDIRCHGLYVRGDSQIVISQLNEDFHVRSSRIMNYYYDAHDLLHNQVSCTYFNICHIHRSRNYLADELANQAIDRFPYY